MPPKVMFTRDDVIRAAFEVVKKNGFRDFTARRIAAELKSSTAPVYSSFSSMDELKNELLSRAEKLVLEYTMRPYTKSVFLNMGTGLVLFAQENRELFRSLLMESNDSRVLLNEFLKTILDELKKDELLSLLPEKDRKEVMNRMALFAYGHAALICVGIIDPIDKNTAIRTMYEMGKDVIEVALKKAGIEKKFPG